MTIAKADGSYELADLPLGAYQISIPGQLQPKTVVIISSSPVLQKVDLQQNSIKSLSSSANLFPGNDRMVFMHFWAKLSFCIQWYS